MTADHTRLDAALRALAARQPEHPALFENGQAWSYGRLFSAVDEVRAWLAREGVRPGDRVLVVNENSVVAVTLLLALIEMDAWPVPVSARLSAREIGVIREHCNARVVIYTVDAAPQARMHAARSGARLAEIPVVGRVAVSDFNRAARAAPVEEDPARQVAALLYTSGTSGRPKGVMLTHANLLFMARTSGAIRRLGQADRFYGVLPISHITGLSVVLLATLVNGGTVCLAPRFDPVAASRALAEEGISVLLGVPTMYALMVKYADANGIGSLPHPALRVIASCGAPLEPALKEAAERLFGLPLHNGYGLSECSPAVAQTRLDEPRLDCSVGRLLPGLEARLIGKDGRPVREGEVGELHVRGPNVMLGYFMAPEETREVIDRQGWFNTRDLARFEKGNLFIVGRTSELIVRFGFNVYPGEIEAVLNLHHAVARSAVIGRRAAAEEEIIAFVEPAPGRSVSTTELARFAAERLASYKRPNEIVLMARLPAGTSGKIRKAELKRAVAELAG